MVRWKEHDVLNPYASLQFLAEHGGHGIGGTDKAMTSHDVNATVSIPKPGKERVLGSSPDLISK